MIIDVKACRIFALVDLSRKHTTITYAQISSFLAETDVEGLRTAENY
jgi:hypothetical protein